MLIVESDKSLIDFLALGMQITHFVIVSDGSEYKRIVFISAHQCAF